MSCWICGGPIPNLSGEAACERCRNKVLDTADLGMLLQAWQAHEARLRVSVPPSVWDVAMPFIQEAV